jgi:type I restriction enzyme R subunit
MADVSDLLKELHKIVNEAIRTQPADGTEEEPPRYFDLSRIDLEKLRDEFDKKVKRKASVIQDIRQIVEAKLAKMLARNPQRMDYYKKYSEIIADYNREKDRITIEDTFARLVDLMNSLDAEQRRAAEEGLTEDELAVFDLLKKPVLGKAEREKVKLASKSLLESVTRLIAPLERWTEKEETKALVEVEILNQVFQFLPNPPFTEEDKQAAAQRVYQHVWQQSQSGHFGDAA